MTPSYILFSGISIRIMTVLLIHELMVFMNINFHELMPFFLTTNCMRAAETSVSYVLCFLSE